MSGWKNYAVHTTPIISDVTSCTYIKAVKNLDIGYGEENTRAINITSSIDNLKRKAIDSDGNALANVKVFNKNHPILFGDIYRCDKSALVLKKNIEVESLKAITGPYFLYSNISSSCIFKNFEKVENEDFKIELLANPKFLYPIDLNTYSVLKVSTKKRVIGPEDIWSFKAPVEKYFLVNSKIEKNKCSNSLIYGPLIYKYSYFDEEEVAKIINVLFAKEINTNNESDNKFILIQKYNEFYELKSLNN